MRTNTMGYIFALLLIGGTAAAQDAKTTTDTTVKSEDGKVVTMTGCVEIGGGTSFVLTNVRSEEKNSARGPYALVERKGLDLSPYILQKVELIGVVVPAATRSDTHDKIKIRDTTTVDKKDGPAKESSKTTSVKVARGATPQFLVASVKTLALNCQP